MAERRYHDRLARELTRLGRAVDPPVSPERIAAAVMARVESLPAPARPTRWTRWRLRSRRWAAAVVASGRRRVALVVAAVMVALLATPPVRAELTDWFGFGGVLVERGAPAPRPAPPPPELGGEWSVPKARDAVDFTVSVPAELGAPEDVGVSVDRRIVSMTWSGGEDGIVRLDQFDGRLDFSLAKTAPRVLFTSVAGADALWFDEAHEVVLLEPDGTRRTESARLAGQTLIWQDGDTTLRVEGDLSLARAVEIAESATPVP